VAVAAAASAAEPEFCTLQPRYPAEALAKIVPPLAALSGKGKGLPAFRKAVREMVAHELHLRNKLSGKAKAGSGEGECWRHNYFTTTLAFCSSCVQCHKVSQA